MYKTGAWIRIWIGINMEIRFRVRIRIKTMPRSTTLIKFGIAAVPKMQLRKTQRRAKPKIKRATGKKEKICGRI